MSASSNSDIRAPVKTNTVTACSGGIKLAAVTPGTDQEITTAARSRDRSYGHDEMTRDKGRPRACGDGYAVVAGSRIRRRPPGG